MSPIRSRSARLGCQRSNDHGSATGEGGATDATTAVARPLPHSTTTRASRLATNAESASGHDERSRPAPYERSRWTRSRSIVSSTGISVSSEKTMSSPTGTTFDGTSLIGFTRPVSIAY